MKIERKQLLNDLQDFALQGDGVIIGSPGVGKTYVLKKLRQRLKTAGIPHLLLRIDQLGNGTPETLRQELSYEGDLIEKLESIPVSGKNAILLFDSFDAARDEQTRKRFLNLIGRAIRELVKWNVVVTVRTYDAMKSRELLDLFGSPDDTQYQSKEILCRHFTIPSFTEEEILQAFDQIGCSKSIYDNGSQDFKDILATPFNLWLLEKILKASHRVPDFSQIHSEVQLLGLFWEHRIESKSNGDIRRFVLNGIAHQMVNERSLSVRQNDLHEDLSLDKSTNKLAWSDLLSDEILAKVSSTGQRIAFSHNILFDYAISVLLVEDEPRQFKRFVLEDSSRPLFLRPSLTYFFTRLWYYDSESFWKAFWHIFPSNQPVHLRLVARLIPASVIANETRVVDQLTPLLRKLRNRETIANQTVMRLLQSLRMLAIERDPLWSEFFDKISEHLHADFAWDLATLTSDILERAVKTENTTIVDACGRIGRRLLEWVWQERETSKDDWYNRFGGRWAVPLVAKTYHTNMEESRALLENVLQLTKEENFPIDFLSQLTEYVDTIWDHDPEFVTSIYLTVFTHYEISDEKIIRGGPILPMATFRHQDYGMCQYRLVERFHNFLQASPLIAARMVIQSLNFFIIRFHIVGDLTDNKTFEELIETFDFRGKSAYFVEDSSYIWDEQPYTDEPIKMADTLFEFISELAVSEDRLLNSLLDVFRDEIWVAFFWKQVLKTAAQFPKTFAPRLFELCLAKPIQMSPETSDELGSFLQVAAPEFTPDQLHRIEKSIVALPRETRNWLLTHIPAHLLLTNSAKKIREEIEVKKDIPESPRPISFHFSSEPYTEEERFQERGVDITRHENQGLHCFFKPLDEFSSNWRNEMPTAAAIRLIFPQLEKAYAILKSDTKAEREVINLLWLKLTDCIAILSRVAEDPESSLFTFCRQVLLEGAKHEQPKPNPSYDDQFDSSAYAPYPRHGAAQGLLRLAFHGPDEEILGAIEVLANDPVPSVRMVTTMELTNVYAASPQKFWYIMDNRAAQEQNRVVQQRLYTTLTLVVGRKKENENQTTRIMAKLLEHTPPTERLRPSDSFVPLLMWLAINRENLWALKTIEDIFFQDPIKFANLLARAASEAMRRYVTPKHLETVEGRERAKRAILWVSSVITIASDEIAKLYSPSNEYRTEEETEKLRETYTIIETVIRCLYSAVGRKPDSPEKQTEEISSELHCEFYNAVGTLMRQVVKDSEKGIMLAKTAHYFMRVLTSFLSCDPKSVLHLAAEIVKSSERFGYNLDSIAAMDVVEFVEIVLADHRDEVRDGEALEDLLNLLDMFAKTGWTDALKLVWRLDEVFR